MVAQTETESLPIGARIRARFEEQIAAMRRPGPVTLALLALAAAVIVGALILSVLASRTDAIATMDKAWMSLSAGEYSRSREIATQFISQNGSDAPKVSEAAFVIGRSLCGEAEDEWNLERKQGLYLVASRYLQEAYNRGMPKGFELEGLRYLALSTFLSGRATASLPTWVELLETTEVHPQLIKEANRYLARVYLMDRKLDPVEGLPYINDYLANDDLSTEERSLGMIDKAELLLRAGRCDEGLETIEEIPDIEVRPSRRRLFKGRFLLKKAIERDEQNTVPDNTIIGEYEDALDVLTSVVTDLDDELGQDEEAIYFMATCYGRMGDLDEATRYFSELRRDKLTDPLGWAAGIEAAYMLYLDGRIDEAAESCLAVLEQTSRHPDVENFWMPPDVMSARLAPILQQMVNDQRFDEAEEIAKRMWPPLSRSDSLLWQAKIHDSWGKALLKEARLKANEGLQDSGETKARGLSHLRQSGLAYYKLANLKRDSANYVDYLWLAAEGYLKGHDFDEAIRLYETLQEENIPERIARLYYKMGEAYLASGRTAKALSALERCIAERPTDPDTYSARLLASQIYMDRAELELAKQLLIDNLEQEALTPKSVEWRESLFALGRALFREAATLEAQSRVEGVDSEDAQRVEVGLETLEASHTKFQDAILRLGEAVQRYDGESPAFEHRYLLAEAYRQSAKWPAKKSRWVTVATTRYRLQEQARQAYANALQVYEHLLADLAREQDRRPLNETEKRLLRNTYFTRADMLFELKDYPAAIDAYSSAANQYNQEPESLEAFVRIASCYRFLDRYADARGVLEQAKLFLEERIPPDADFETTTRYSRDEWASFLDILITL